MVNRHAGGHGPIGRRLLPLLFTPLFLWINSAPGLAQVPPVGPGRCIANCGSPTPSRPTPGPYRPPGPSPQEKERKRAVSFYDASDKGYRAYQQGDWDAAIHYFQQALSYAPHNPTMQHNLRRAKERKAQALAAARRQREEADRRAREAALRRAEEERRRKAEEERLQKAAALRRAEQEAEAVLLKEKADRKESIEKLRAQIRGFQEALRRMNPSLRPKGERREWFAQKELEEWKQRAKKTEESAISRGKSLMIDLTIGRVVGAFDAHLKLLGGRIARAETLLKTTKNPDHRRRLKEILTTWNRERSRMLKAKFRLADQMERAKSVYDRVEVAKSDASEREKALRQAHQTVKDVMFDATVKDAWETALRDARVFQKTGGKLDHPGLKRLSQDALKEAKNFLAVVQFADSYVDSAYEITAGAVSWARISQANLNMEQYLDAVGRIKVNMEKAVREIKKLER